MSAIGAAVCIALSGIALHQPNTETIAISGMTLALDSGLAKTMNCTPIPGVRIRALPSLISG